MWTLVRILLFFLIYHVLDLLSYLPRNCCVLFVESSSSKNVKVNEAFESGSRGTFLSGTTIIGGNIQECNFHEGVIFRGQIS